MKDNTDYLETLSLAQREWLYEVSELPKGQIDTDYVAGYWAMWAGWPRPHSYPEALTGWLEAVKDYEEAQ